MLLIKRFIQFDNDDYDDDDQLKKVWPAAINKAREERTITSLKTLHDADQEIHSV